MTVQLEPRADGGLEEGAAIRGELDLPEEGGDGGAIVVYGDGLDVGAVAGEDEHAVDVDAEGVREQVAGIGGWNAFASDPSAHDRRGEIETAGEVGHVPFAALELALQPAGKLTT